MANDFFPQRPDAHPMIYAYEDTNPQYAGLLKVGYTAIDVDKRVAQQYPTKRPDGSVPYRIVYRESAMYPDGSSFTDHDVHRALKRKQITGMGGEWFRCTVNYENEVQKWLDLIRGAYLETSVDDLKLGAKKPAMPYADVRLLNVLQHTLWFLPNVASCYAMKNLLVQKQNTFYHDYTINVCAGTGAGIGAAALEPVQKSMRDPLESKTITLSCGKLTTGVTVKPWTGIFMLRNLSSSETYFQAAFRVQSPWEITTDDGKKEIVKKECYVFDFALDRALKQISDYSCRLNIDEGNPEKKVAEFINFLPVINPNSIQVITSYSDIGFAQMSRR